SELYRKSIGGEEHERINVAAHLLQLAHAVSECLSELLLFFLKFLSYGVCCCLHKRICVCVGGAVSFRNFSEYGISDTELVGLTNRAANEAAKYISLFGIARTNAGGNEERRGAHMVKNN